MASRKTDYFGTFLGTLADASSPISSTKPSRTTPASGSSTNVVSIEDLETYLANQPSVDLNFNVLKKAFNVAPVVRPATKDPLNEVLKALKHGDRSIKDLLAYTDNSLSAALSVTEQLTSLGYIERVDRDSWHLTQAGRDIAEMLE
jgi:hypothetical protein